MLIKFDDLLADDINLLSSTEWDALANLAVAGRDGLHFILPQPRLAEFLSKSQKLSTRERGFYSHMGQRYPTLAGIGMSVETFVRIKRNIGIEKRAEGHQTVFEVPLSYFNTIASCQSSVLLCENLEDCSVAIEMAKAFARYKRLNLFKTKFNLQQGGGSGVGAVLSHLLERDQDFVLTIVDSDQKSPSSAKGSTARTTQTVFDRFNNRIAELVIIKAREMENILPDNFYIQESEVNKANKKTLDFICSLSEAGCFQSRFFIDIKSGMTLGHIFDLRNYPCFETTWTPLLNAIIIKKLHPVTNCEPCLNSQVCQNIESCKCVITNPQTGQLLSRAILALAREGKSWIETMPESLRSQYLQLARKVFDWGIAPTQLST